MAERAGDWIPFYRKEVMRAKDPDWTIAVLTQGTKRSSRSEDRRWRWEMAERCRSIIDRKDTSCHNLFFDHAMRAHDMENDMMLACWEGRRKRGPRKRWMKEIHTMSADMSLAELRDAAEDRDLWRKLSMTIARVIRADRTRWQGEVMISHWNGNAILSLMIMLLLMMMMSLMTTMMFPMLLMMTIII